MSVTKNHPTWCPGCGNFGILGAINMTLGQLNLEPHQLCVVYDVGCSGNMADFVYAYGFHSLHGRALATAAGIKLGNHQLPVLNIIGDGGCFGEGVGHLIGMAKGNHDITVLSHDNFLYSLTTGQKSPTTPKGKATPSTPNGNPEEALNPLALALINHATFVARGFAGDIPHLSSLLSAAITHKGFAILDVLQPCPTYNKDRPYQWYRENIYKLDDKQHDPTNFQSALKIAQATDKLATGILYQVQKPAYHQLMSSIASDTLVNQSLSSIDLTKAIAEFT